MNDYGKVSFDIQSPGNVGFNIRPLDNVGFDLNNARTIPIGGTSDYDRLTNKPTLNGVEISGDKTSEDYGITGGTTDYSMLTNLPAINNKPLTSGENSLSALGIGRASNAEINKLF